VKGGSVLIRRTVSSLLSAPVRRYPTYGYYQEGFPQLSGDGESILVPCYDKANGGTYSSESNLKTIAVIDSQGRVSTRNRATDVYDSTYYSYFRSVAAQTGTGPYFLGGIGLNNTADTGVHYFANETYSPTGTTTQLSQIGGNDLRQVMVYNGALWVLTGPGEWANGGGLMTFGADLGALPTGVLQNTDINLVVPLRGSALSSPTAFTFQDANNVWMTDLNPTTWGQVRAQAAGAAAAAAGGSPSLPPDEPPSRPRSRRRLPTAPIAAPTAVSTAVCRSSCLAPTPSRASGACRTGPTSRRAPR
jgi:hypothetical protein